MIFSLLFMTRRSTLGLISLDVLVSETLDLPSKVTQYPVEDGGPDISDHITQGTEELAINGMISHGGIDAFEFGICTHKLIDAIETFRDMHTSRQTITVVTGLMVYEDMGFDGVTITRNNSNDRGGNWLEISAKLKKVIKVTLQEGELPPDQVDATDGDPEGSTKGKTGKTEGKFNKGAKKGKEQFGPPDRATTPLGKMMGRAE